ncbi:MAG: DNA primase, partial [Tissierellia bacterium]|nr:DNA primase [Tissierellia bacterium]
MKFTLYASDTKGNLSNCLYPRKIEVVDTASFIEAIKFDHVSAKYKDNYRSNANFIKSDNLVLDCDNDHSDDPNDWVTSLDVAMVFSGIPFVIAYSRNNQREKGSKSARPRFHVYFMIPEITDQAEYAYLKQQIASMFPYFDTNAIDSARFIFGTDNAVVEVFEGDKSILGLIDETIFSNWDEEQEEIPEGKRNNTMSHYAGRIIKRFGNTDEAYELFLKQAEKCNPPLEDRELKVIWASAISFGKKISFQEDYIPPEKYNAEFGLKPPEYSDIGQAEVFVREYQDTVRYSTSTKFLVYNGSYWEESDLKAQGLSQDLANRQVEEADVLLKKAREEMRENGALELLDSLTTKKAISLFNKEQSHSYSRYLMAENYKKYAIKRGDTRAIHATTKEAMPMLEIEQKELDQDEFLLNTPSCTIDLRTSEKLEHDPLHFITKQTAVDPDTENLKLWLDALDVFFQGDEELIDYVQKVTGLATIGKVYEEAMIIAYGDGRNGKSTFWNAIARVLGNYSGAISADILTVGCKRNAKPELAEARGKRLLIAAELEEGMRLSTSNVKQLSSTDEINAEKKYKAPFKFVPSHTLVLYTNHLPKVGAIDEGTWRRLIVIPFQAKLEGTSDIKNYGDHLFTKAGGAILSWAIDGAKKAIEEDYKIHKPQIVQDAIGKYRESNDWFNHFIIECCEIGEDFEEKSGELYQEYRAFCFRTGEYTRSTAQ